MRFCILCRLKSSCCLFACIMYWPRIKFILSYLKQDWISYEILYLVLVIEFNRACVACMLWQNKTGFLMRLYIVTKQDWISHKIVCCDKTRLDFSWDCMLWQNKTGFLMRLYVVTKQDWISHEIVCCDKTRLDFSWDFVS